MTAIAVNYQTVTPAMIGAAHKVFGPDNRAFYKVENSKGELDADGSIKEYTVKAIRKNNRWHVTCDCLAGNEGRQCWHKRAAMAAAKEERDAMAEQVALNAAAAAAPAKRFIPTPAQEEIDRFWAFRPEMMNEAEREAFAAKHPELVEEYIDCWTEYLEK